MRAQRSGELEAAFSVELAVGINLGMTLMKLRSSRSDDPGRSMPEPPGRTRLGPSQYGATRSSSSFFTS